MTNIQADGARIQNELNAYVPENFDIRPTEDRVVIEILPWRPSKIIEVASKRKVRGKILAVGPGSYPWKYDGPKGKRTKRWRSKVFVPTSVKPGEEVELGGLEIEEYLHQTFMWGTKRVLLCQESDIAGVYE
jgi:co-chaperonin GroES (HSP10)